jgi:1-acyl-sn-glycerol-3-phosphate acyltransferase
MLKLLCTLIFKFKGWTFKNNLPDELRSFVLLGVPHTSNFDFVPAMYVAKHLKRNPRFVIKSDWMKFPFNLVMGPAGAIGLDRSKLVSRGGSNTDLMADLFKTYPDLVLMIAPEGTRRANHNWKTGFYYIAQKAQVPIVLGYIDYEKKETGIGPVIYPTDFEKDMQAIMAFYQHVKGRYPDNFKLDQRFL